MTKEKAKRRGKKTKHFLEQWKYYQVGKKEFEQSDSQLARHNISSLKVIVLSAAVMMFVFIAFPIFIENRLDKALVYLTCGALELVIYFFVRRQYRQEKLSNNQVYISFLPFFIVLISFSVYIGIFEALDKFALNFIVYLICGQILFVFSPLKNLLTNLITSTIFLALSIGLKPSEVWVVDLTNITMASIIGILFNWQVGAVIVREKVVTRKMEQQRNEYKEKSTRDSLTVLWNRRGFFQQAESHCEQWKNENKNICVLMMDLDFFKNYNDFYGHPQGDKVLQAVGVVLNDFKDTLAARVGGEEFIMLWAQKDKDMAEQKTHLVQSRIHSLEIPHEKSEVGSCMTASFGLYIAENGDFTSIDELYAYADLALYEAKHQGRDCIVRCVNKEQQFVSVSQ